MTPPAVRRPPAAARRRAGPRPRETRRAGPRPRETRRTAATTWRTAATQSSAAARERGPVANLRRKRVVQRGRNAATPWTAARRRLVTDMGSKGQNCN